MDNQDKTVSTADIAESHRQLSETHNDPNMILCSWCHTLCLKCGMFAGQCKCKDQPWNMNFEDRQKWLREH